MSEMTFVYLQILTNVSTTPAVTVPHVGTSLAGSSVNVHQVGQVHCVRQMRMNAVEGLVLMEADVRIRLVPSDVSVHQDGLDSCVTKVGGSVCLTGNIYMNC